MAPRLVELRRVLQANGSLYLHCDPTSGHYLKVLLEAVFGPVNFRADITWRRTGTHSDAKRWSPIADTLLHYSKSTEYIWNSLFMPHSEDYLEQKYRFTEPDGRRVQTGQHDQPEASPQHDVRVEGTRLAAIRLALF